MLKNFKRFFIIALFTLLITSTVFAEDISTTSPIHDNTISSINSKNDDRDKDISVRNNDNYSINENINGNAFIKSPPNFKFSII